MISKDQQIITQTIAKIASELTCKTNATDVEDILDNFNKIFNALLEDINKVIGEDSSPVVGRQIPVLKQEDMAAKLNEVKQEIAVGASDAQVASARPVRGSRKRSEGTVTVKGTSNGPLPQWLIRAATKAGISEVYDNRDTATSENKRPHFVSTGSDRKAFWPPKDIVVEDGSLEMPLNKFVPKEF